LESAYNKPVASKVPEPNVETENAKTVRIKTTVPRTATDRKIPFYSAPPRNVRDNTKRALQIMAVQRSSHASIVAMALVKSNAFRAVCNKQGSRFLLSSLLHVFNRQDV